jgi:alginate O-acetyltransferase complex protein AlgI
MIFSSWQFILLFLPITLIVYFWLNSRRLITGGKIWLVATSLFFYAYWDIQYLPLILGSVVFNYALGTGLAQSYKGNTKSALNSNRKITLTIGIFANLALLAYFKYTDFFLENLNYIAGTEYSLPHILLPLAISFFTFTQIVYLVDSYRGETAQYDLLNYSLFVTFFPHLIAGPIVQHRQIMPQFLSRWTWAVRYSNIVKGLFIFSIGLFKKVVIADSFAVWATAGFDGSHELGFYEAWATSLSYTFQLYFDFSGYCDMAIGASLLFNIWLPINFNSPYKALSIQDFWRRWHITLSHFLRDYLYIPFGGNRNGELRTYINLFATFLLGGLWHGATWMFVIWGALHGAALMLHRLWSKIGKPLPTAFAWFITFMFINVTWVFFRANTLNDATRVLTGMFDLSKLTVQDSSLSQVKNLSWSGWLGDYLLKILPSPLIGQLPVFVAIAIALLLISGKNSLELAEGRINNIRLSYSLILFITAMYFVLGSTSSVFLYFNF